MGRAIGSFVSPELEITLISFPITDRYAGGLYSEAGLHQVSGSYFGKRPALALKARIEKQCEESYSTMRVPDKEEEMELMSDFAFSDRELELFLKVEEVIYKN